MKIVKNLIISLLFTLFFFSFFSNIAISATTIGNTTFPADVGKTYTWKATHPPTLSGTRFAFKVESIYQGIYDSLETLIVNGTFQAYNPMFGWVDWIENETYIAANNTQNYLAFENYIYPVLIPTPINLTLVAEAIYAYNYSIVGNTIINTYYGDTAEYTYNNNGFMTLFQLTKGGELELRFVLVTGDGAIPFGRYFLIFIVIGVVALVFLNKRKIF